MKKCLIFVHECAQQNVRIERTDKTRVKILKVGDRGSLAR